MNIKFSDDSALWDQRLQCLKQLRESRVDVGLTASASPRSRSKSSLHRLIRISQSRWQLKQQISFSLKTLAEIIAILSQSAHKINLFCGSGWCKGPAFQKRYGRDRDRVSSASRDLCNIKKGSFQNNVIKLR